MEDMTQEQAQTQGQSQDEERDLPFFARFEDVFQDSAWWIVSFVFHAFLMAILMLFGATVQIKVIDDAPLTASRFIGQHDWCREGVRASTPVGATPRRPL